jgi:flagellar FliJ protein
MKKFKFSLEKVLSLREFEEKQAQIELGKAQSVVNDLNNQLKYIASEKLKTNEARSNSSDLSFLISIEKYMNGLEYKKELLLEELAKAQLVLEEKRAIVVEAIKKRKSLEKLKEKQFDEYKKQYNLEEEKILDEISTSKFSK